MQVEFNVSIDGKVKRLESNCQHGSGAQDGDLT